MRRGKGTFIPTPKPTDELTRHSKGYFIADDLVNACRNSMSQREEGLEEETQHKSVMSDEEENTDPAPSPSSSRRNPYPVDASADNAAVVDVGAQFRAARARVAKTYSTLNPSWERSRTLAGRSRGNTQCISFKNNSQYSLILGSCFE